MRPRPALVAVCAAAATFFLASERARAGGVDHYIDYDFGNGTAGPGPIVLTDQWGQSTHANISSLGFLPPTQQDDEPIIDPTAWYTKWAIGIGNEPTRNILVTNKFGEDQPWTIRYHVWMLTPAIKGETPGELPDRNHYKCYAANGPQTNQPVTLVDQFGTYPVTVVQPAIWCNPAEKVHDGVTYPIVDELVHLACYEIDPSGFFFPFIPLTVTDQFLVLQEYEISSRNYLCVPAFKAMPVPNEPLSWGEVKAVYR